MAEHLASIFGTDNDRVNCPFSFKIGACRHGDRCSRLHTKPTISPTLLLSNMYQRPYILTPGVDASAQNSNLDTRKVQDHFEDIYEDSFEELSKYGDIENLNICDNIADHMVGNVYVQFREEEHATNALQSDREVLCRLIGVGFKQELFRPSGLSVWLYFPANIVNCPSLRKQSDGQHFFRELRRRLFGRSRHRRSRSRSPHKHPSHEHRGHDSHGSGRREDDRERRHHDREKCAWLPVWLSNRNLSVAKYELGVGMSLWLNLKFWG